jgi:hypothetical protein
LKNSFYFGKRCLNVSAEPVAKTISNTADIAERLKETGYARRSVLKMPSRYVTYEAHWQFEKQGYEIKYSQAIFRVLIYGG